jgi:type I restriction enzyme R subunit
MAELAFEKALVDKLETFGWEYNKELSGASYKKIIEHWRERLDIQNIEYLSGISLSDNEFNLVLASLERIKTPYDAQLILAGAGGVGTIGLTRDNGEHVDLRIFFPDDIGAGKSKYEVVRQVNFTDLPNDLAQKRIIDVMLLINGIPVAHVELKDEKLQNQWDAFEQLKKYDSAGMYHGLFAFIQIMVIMGQNASHYFARPNSLENYNKTFVFGWRDEDGKDITNAFEFANQVLGIPALHRLVTTNMIPDAANDNLMVMRSYQIQATRAILDRVKEMDENGVVEKEGGYIWHTTGSGKTVTSFKVAQLLASMPNIRHVLFVVDRVDLVAQTATNFKEYAYVNFVDRINVVNGHELKKGFTRPGYVSKGLKDSQSQIFLISIQGLDKAVKEGHLTSDERNIIIMDEAHRSANGDAVERIKKAFKKTTWFGFTGTPNFYSDSENDIKTKKKFSTYEVFGKQLHRYTIKDAIGDGNVLGFDITYH